MVRQIGWVVQNWPCKKDVVFSRTPLFFSRFNFASAWVIFDGAFSLWVSLNTIEGLISKPWINSYISHDELVSVNNLLREYNGMKEEIKNPETSVECTI